jgi:hypothetical protein
MIKTDHPRREQVSIRLSTAEREVIEALAAKCGLPIPDYVRQRVLPSGAELSRRPVYRLRRNGIDGVPDAE